MSKQLDRKESVPEEENPFTPRQTDEAGWEPVGEEFIQWETIGDVAEGMIVHTDEVAMVNGKIVPRYVLERDGKNYGFLAPAELARKLALLPQGTYIRVRYIGDTPSKRGNPLKNFDVKRHAGLSL